MYVVFSVSLQMWDKCFFFQIFPFVFCLIMCCTLAGKVVRYHSLVDLLAKGKEVSFLTSLIEQAKHIDGEYWRGQLSPMPGHRIQDLCLLRLSDG